MAFSKAFFGALGGLLLLSGCQVTVATDVTVESSSDAKLVASVTFENEAATAILNDANLEDQIEEILGERTGSVVERHSSDNLITYEADLPYEQLKESSGILGLQSATLNGGEEDAKLSLTLTKPAELIEAITAANAGAVDSEAITDTILKTSYVEVRVNYPGDIALAEGPGEISTKDNRSTLKMPLDQFEAGVFTVEGSTKAPLLTTQNIIIGGILLLGIIGCAAYFVYTSVFVLRVE